MCFLIDSALLLKDDDRVREYVGSSVRDEGGSYISWALCLRVERGKGPIDGRVERADARNGGVLPGEGWVWEVESVKWMEREKKGRKNVRGKKEGKVLKKKRGVHPLAFGSLEKDNHGGCRHQRFLFKVARGVNRTSQSNNGSDMKSRSNICPS